MTKKWMIPGVLVVSLLLVSIALAAPNAPGIDWWVIGGGGGSDTAGSTSLGGTAGQWVAGSDAAGSTQLRSGFWCGAGETSHSIYLSLVLRQR